MTPQLARSIKATARAQDRRDRMAQLSAMSAAQLAVALGSDPPTAAPWVEAAAAHGLAAAQLQLGRMLLDGTGLARDQRQALRWFVAAARGAGASLGQRGEAQNMVGRCHELGWGTAPDAAAAVRWYRRAAASGAPWGRYNLANMLFDGRGIGQDRAAACRLYERAARAGHARAMNLLGRCREEGWGIPRDAAAAAEWYRRSAEAGYFRAKINHGLELLCQGRRAAAAVQFHSAAADADPPLLARIASLAHTA